MKTHIILLVLLSLVAACSDDDASSQDYELNASFRAVEPGTGEERLWLRPEQAAPVLRYVLNRYRELCEGVLCEYRANALLNILPRSPLGSPLYELDRYAAGDPALRYIVDELFPLHIQVEKKADPQANRVVFIEEANSGSPGDLVAATSSSVAVIAARDGKLFRALASGDPDQMLSVDCVTDSDREGIADLLTSDIAGCPAVDVLDTWDAEANRLLDLAKLAWQEKEHNCDERPCHGLYPVTYFGEQKYALINWGQFERFVDKLDYQVCANQEHTNVWACLLDIQAGT